MLNDNVFCVIIVCKDAHMLPPNFFTKLVYRTLREYSREQRLGNSNSLAQIMSIPKGMLLSSKIVLHRQNLSLN